MSAPTSASVDRATTNMSPGRQPKVLNTTSSISVANKPANGLERATSVPNVCTSGTRTSIPTNTAISKNETNFFSVNNMLPHLPLRSLSATQNKLFCPSHPISGSASHILPSSNTLYNTSYGLTSTLSNTFCYTPLAESKLMQEVKENSLSDALRANESAKIVHGNQPYSFSHSTFAAPLGCVPNTHDYYTNVNNMETHASDKLFNVRPRPPSSMAGSYNSSIATNNSTTQTQNAKTSTDNTLVDNKYNKKDNTIVSSREMNKTSLTENSALNQSRERPLSRYGVRLTVSPIAGPWTLRRIQGRIKQARVQAEQFYNYAKAIEMLISVQMGLQAASSSKRDWLNGINNNNTTDNNNNNNNGTTCKARSKRVNENVADEYMTPEQLIRYVGVIGREIQYVTALWVEALQCSELLSINAYEHDVDECRRRSAELIAKFKAAQEANKRAKEEVDSMKAMPEAELKVDMLPVKGQHIRVSIGEYVDHSHDLAPYRKVMRVEKGELEEFQEEEEQEEEEEEKEKNIRHINHDGNLSHQEHQPCNEELLQQEKEALDKERMSNEGNTEESNKSNIIPEEVDRRTANDTIDDKVDKSNKKPSELLELDDQHLETNVKISANDVKEERDNDVKDVLVQFDVFQSEIDANVDVEVNNTHSRDKNSNSVAQETSLLLNEADEELRKSPEPIFSAHAPSDYEETNDDNSFVSTHTNEPQYSTTGPRLSRSTSIAEQRRKSKLNARRHIPRVMPKVDCPSNNSSLVGELAPGLDDEILGQGNGLNPFEQGIKYTSMNFRSTAESGVHSPNQSRHFKSDANNTLTHDSELDFLLRKRNDQAASLDVVVGIDSPNMTNAERDFAQTDAEHKSNSTSEAKKENASSSISNNDANERAKLKENDKEKMMIDKVKTEEVGNELTNISERCKKSIYDESSLNNTKNTLVETKIYKEPFDAFSNDRETNFDIKTNINVNDNDTVNKVNTESTSMNNEDANHNVKTEENKLNERSANVNRKADCRDNFMVERTIYESKEDESSKYLIENNNINNKNTNNNNFTFIPELSSKSNITEAKEACANQIQDQTNVEANYIESSSDKHTKFPVANTKIISEKVKVKENVKDCNNDDDINEEITIFPEYTLHMPESNVATNNLNEKNTIESVEHKPINVLPNVNKLSTTAMHTNLPARPFIYSSDILGEHLGNNILQYTPCNTESDKVDINTVSTMNNIKRDDNDDDDEEKQVKQKVNDATICNKNTHSATEMPKKEQVNNKIDQIVFLNDNDGERVATLRKAYQADDAFTDKLNAHNVDQSEFATIKDKNNTILYPTKPTTTTTTTETTKVKPKYVRKYVSNASSSVSSPLAVSKHSSSLASILHNCCYGFPPSFGPGTDTYRPVHASGYINANDVESNYTTRNGTPTSVASREFNTTKCSYCNDSITGHQRRNRLFAPQQWHNADGKELLSPLSWLRESKHENMDRKEQRNKSQVNKTKTETNEHAEQVNSSCNYKINGSNKVFSTSNDGDDKECNKREEKRKMEQVNNRATWPV